VPPCPGGVRSRSLLSGIVLADEVHRDGAAGHGAQQAVVLALVVPVVAWPLGVLPLVLVVGFVELGLARSASSGGIGQASVQRHG
jgi:hypothetical protein